MSVKRLFEFASDDERKRLREARLSNSQRMVSLFLTGRMENPQVPKAVVDKRRKKNKMARLSRRKNRRK